MSPQPDQRLDLSIVIVSWNTRELLRECLDSILVTVRQLRLEIFVVDNASHDGTVPMVRAEFPSVRLIENKENVGFARANNQAIQHSRGRYLMLLNSDTLVLPGAIERMLACMEARPDVGVMGPMHLNPDGSFQASFNDFPTLVPELLTVLGLSRRVYSPYHPSYPPQQSQVARQVEWVGGACLLVRREAMDRVGLLDEAYFMYTEEADWCYRMKQAGWQVYYLPEAQIVHWGGKSVEQRGQWKWVQLCRSKLLFFRKHHGPAPAALLGLAVLLSSALKTLACVAALPFGDEIRREELRQRIDYYAACMREL